MEVEYNLYMTDYQHITPPPRLYRVTSAESIGKDQQSKRRQSNVELLRIVAMLGVVVLHINFETFGVPTKNIMEAAPVSGIMRVLLEAIFIGATNVFVIISGYFGIRFRVKSLLNLLFQCAFFFFGIWIFMMSLGKVPFSLDNIARCLMLPHETAWFVKCYLGLYILAPVLNRFIDSCNKKEFITVLISFYVLQSIYGWMANATNYFSSGYSAYSFVGLYLLGRYVNIHKPSFALQKNTFNILIFTLLTIGIAAMIFAGIYCGNPGLVGRSLAYSNPLVIAQAVFALLIFLNFRLSSSVINWIAASCFAVFLGHFMIFKYIQNAAVRISESYSGLLMIGLLTALVILFFSVCILVDKIRLLAWNNLSNGLTQFHKSQS